MPAGNHPVPPSPARPGLSLTVDGVAVEVPDDGGTLLDALRDHAGVRSAKDGCSPQGQCGCCTVLVDGQARVACVTPARRVVGRAITTVDGLADRDRWAGALCATGGSQCGFCTAGIAVRLSALAASPRWATPADPDGVAACERALLAHLCRCTGWQPVVDAWRLVTGPSSGPSGAEADRLSPDDGEPGSSGPSGAVSVRANPNDPWAGRDPDAAARRATMEGGGAQAVGPDVALGAAPFAADTAPARSLVAVPGGDGDWAVGETLADARRAAGKVQGRRTTVAAGPPLDLPAGDWAVSLRTSWCEPAYLETDASWCSPGGVPSTPLANGGAFGGKVASPLPDVARRLADEHGRPVLAVWSREDATRLGPKRPPVAAGVRADGTGTVRVARTDGIAAALRSIPGLDLVVEEVELAGPPTSSGLRAAGWAEVAVLAAGLAGDPEVTVVDPVTGGRATAVVDGGGVRVRVAAGAGLDEVVLRSYCTGAVHQALGWITSEGLAVADDGEVLDLTIRSFGILRAVDLPPITIELDEADGAADPANAPPVRASDAVFAAVAGAVWVAQGCPPDVPTGGKLPR